MEDIPSPSLSDNDVGGASEQNQIPSNAKLSLLTSSFVPIENSTAIQIIDENKRFNQKILDYISLAPDNSDHGEFQIVSVFGSQSTGKSTLLNHLFNTSFDVMDEVNRQQTTKGIWLAHSPGVKKHSNVQETSNLLVMDVEGTDGRERGEDQDFERKAALFALSTSEILIVNIWETQVGLYQGANMGLLKTVFEVNLSLFGRTKLQNNDHKVLLLFVIRDHIGVTPKESLSATITQDLLKIWDSLNKPEEVAHLKFDDFFDLAFHTLSHKILQSDKFAHDIRLLGDRFVDQSVLDYLFKPYYHHDIPIEGWTMYAESCWEQIDNNKDLDLPTQQILVAKFKCDEIAAQCLEEASAKLGALRTSAESAVSGASLLVLEINYREVGLLFTDLKNEVLDDFSQQASKYNRSVFEEKKATLSDKLNTHFLETFEIYARHLASVTIKSLASALSKKSNRTGTFTETVNTLTDRSLSLFETNIAVMTISGALPSAHYLADVKEKVNAVVSKQQIVEMNGIVSKHLKKLNNALSTVILEEIGNPTENTWDNILKKFTETNDELISKYNKEGKVDFELGASEDLNKATLDTIEFKSWELLNTLIHKHINKDSLLAILKDRFDDKFRYDENGVPKLYQNSHELELSFGASREHALNALPILTFAKLSNGKELQPKVDIHKKSLQRKFSSVGAKAEENEEEDYEDEDEDEDEDERPFAEIVSKQEKLDVVSRFKKEADARFVETKRSILQHVTQIPYWIYIVIIVLGWNEFMAVLRNPFFFTLLLVAGAGVYVLYSLNLLSPSIAVAQRLVDESIAMGKEKLRELILEDHQQHGSNLAKMASKEEDSKDEE